MSETRKLAERIAERLFVNGAGQKAKRLVLELENGGNGGGWCKGAAVDRIEEILTAASVADEPHPLECPVCEDDVNKCDCMPEEYVRKANAASLTASQPQEAKP